MRGVGKTGRLVEKRKREKNGVDVFGGRISMRRVGGDGCHEISSKFSGNFPEIYRNRGCVWGLQNDIV